MSIMRIGVDSPRRPVMEECKSRSIPIIVSANSLWNEKQNRFRSTVRYDGHDVALDSGGYVAMRLYGGFRFSEAAYAELARSMNPSWWAQMDQCCEPEIAADAGAVQQRIEATARNLRELEIIARGEGQCLPMPVIQGWSPSDYISGPIYEGHEWPALVGVGSVCRRKLSGPCGLGAVMLALCSAVPAAVKFHLFGVKSSALPQLMSEFGDRIESFDSQAWNFTTSYECHAAGVPCTNVERAAGMVRWEARQRQLLTNIQMVLPF